MTATDTDTASRPIRVWDLPLRIWHWTMAGVLAVSLYTGLSGQIHLFDLHATAGYTIVGLLFFRLGWGFWGGVYARWHNYGTSPLRLLAYARGMHDPRQAHTPPGAAMAVLVWAVIAVQAGSGLFSSDFIFNSGPLASYLSDGGVRRATWIHVRAFWIIIALVTLHVAAITGYWVVRRDPLALAMITGSKPMVGEPTPNMLLRGLVTAVGAAWVTRLVINY
jgi:cytochrome b